MSRSQALKEEIKTSLGTGPHPRGKSMLRSVTDLFIHRASDYSDEQVEVFDDVMFCLLDYTEHEARVELSSRLASVPRTPSKVVRTLLNDRDPAVSAPVLSKLSTVPEPDLAEFVKYTLEEKAIIIAKLPHVAKVVTDALIARKNPAITRAVLANPGAELSETGFVTLIGECTNDAEIGNMLAARKDLPPELKPFLDAYKQEPKQPPQDARKKIVRR
jgi:uncharacterized protein (DUF2336 family)